MEGTQSVWEWSTGMTGGWHGGPHADADGEEREAHGAEGEQHRDAEGDEAPTRRWQELIALWRDLPDPEWNQERSDRVFEKVLLAVDRRQQRRRMAWLAACAIVPFVAAAWLGSRRRT